MNTDFTAVIVGRNRREFLVRALNSLLESDITPKEIIYVDTGSVSPIPEYIRGEFPRINVVSLNGGNPQIGRNIGGMMAKTPYVLFADDDIAFDARCISRGLSLLDRQPLVGLVGWNTACACYNSNCIGYTTMSPFWLSREGQQKDWQGAKQVYTVRNAYFMRTAVFKEIKGWDEDLYIQFDENDICYRLYLAGYSVACIGDTPIVDLNCANRNIHSYIKEVGMDRYALGVRNTILVGVKTLSFPSLLTIFPIAISFVILRSILDKSLFSAISGISSSTRTLNTFRKKRSEVRHIPWMNELKIISQLLRERELSVHDAMD